MSVSAIAVLGVTNLLTPLSYASAQETPQYSAITFPALYQATLKFLMPDEDVYLKAYAEPNKYFVEYEGNDSTSGDMGSGMYTYDTAGDLPTNTYTKTGYTFEEWNRQADGNGTGYPDGATGVVYNWTATESGTEYVYAKWTANHYLIHYDLNKGEGSTDPEYGDEHPEEAVYNSGFTVDNPSRDGYDFSGWNISDMDSYEHTVGGATSSATSAEKVMGTSFNNLTAESGGTVNFTATWTAQLKQYLVNYFQEALNGDMELYEIYTGSAATDSTVTGNRIDYTGFTKPAEQSTKVTADGNAHIDYNYTRNPYALELNAGRGIASATAAGTVSPALTVSASGSDSKQFKFEEPITLTFTLKDGYENGEWTGSNNNESGFNMPAEAISKTVFATPIPYTITYNTTSGTVSPANPTGYTVESGAFTLNNPTRVHSKFEGWTGGVIGGAQLASASNSVEIGPNATGHRSYTATWSCHSGYYLSSDTTVCRPKDDTEYKVNHYLQDFDGSYTIYTGYTIQTGTTESTTSGKANTYEGFTTHDIESDVITGDGSTEIDITYDRLKYTSTVIETSGATVTNTGAHDNQNGTPAGQHQYGDTVTITADIADGYTFNGWTVKDTDGEDVTTLANANATTTTFVMPASAVTIKANTTANTYTITMDPNGGTISGGNTITYTVQSGDFDLPTPTRDNSIFSGWKGTSGTATPATTNPLTIEEGSVGDRRYEAEWGCETGYTLGDDECVANKYTITVDTMDEGNGNESNPHNINAEYSSGITIPNPTQSGYTFAGWTVSGADSTTATVDGHAISQPTSGTVFENLTPTSGATVTLTANWIENTDTKYVVKHYTKNLEGDGYTLARTDSDLSGTTNATLTLSELTGTFVGFEYTGGYLSGTTSGPSGSPVTTTVINKDGTTEIHLYYTRKRHHVYLSGENVTGLTGEGDYDFGQEVTVTATPKTGYHFQKWQGKTDNTFATNVPNTSS